MRQIYQCGYSKATDDGRGCFGTHAGIRAREAAPFVHVETEHVVERALVRRDNLIGMKKAVLGGQDVPGVRPRFGEPT